MFLCVKEKKKFITYNIICSAVGSNISPDPGKTNYVEALCCKS